MDTTLKVDIPVNISSPYKIVGVVAGQNGCCEDRPILITVAIHPNKKVYSCQCACGMWCTSGHETASMALAQYEYMTKRKYEEETE